MAWLEELRRQYAGEPLNEAEAPGEPLALFDRWLRQAIEAQAAQAAPANAMVLATAEADGTPDARVVLLKDVGPGGLVFFSSYAGAKGRQLSGNPRAALVFYWPSVDRQVRIKGVVSRLDPSVSRAYFACRPRPSQLGSAASEQSRVIAARAVLERRLAELDRRYAGRPVPMPDSWGGYICRPSELEFWQGRPNRLHDRLRYRLAQPGRWVLERLSP